ncbi:hypothetical protein AV530_019923 [Patagioenas fasciata monilis]|uniref:Uncharacterized protein n=1 Tax=Patagioenas fasciata monilis TaxID=372326 RepID=A0A1V4J899_PATFA|nr:hypothetical protein AV530_019923 [Patagioenas fasciata monilis]
MAGDPSRDPPAPPRPWQRERLVLAELPQNREWLRRIEKVGTGGLTPPSHSLMFCDSPPSACVASCGVPALTGFLPKLGAIPHPR